MKKLLLLTFASLFFLSFTSSAQITKGSVLLGGGISGGKGKSGSSPNESTSSSFSLYPTLGIAVKDNAVVGLRLSYSRSQSGQSNINFSDKQNGYSAGVFYR